MTLAYSGKRQGLNLACKDFHYLRGQYLMVEYCENELYSRKNRDCMLLNLYLVEDRIDVDGQMEVRLLSQVAERLDFVRAGNSGDCGTEHCVHREELYPDIQPHDLVSESLIKRD